MTETHTLRWTLSDGTETYTMHINPNEAGSPYAGREFQKSAGPHRDGRVRVLNTATTSPKEWTISGVIRTQDQHDQLDRWTRKGTKITITDHFGHKFSVIIQAFTPVDRQPTPTVPWRFNYTMTCLVLRQVP